MGQACAGKPDVTPDVMTTYESDGPEAKQIASPLLRSACAWRHPAAAASCDLMVAQRRKSKNKSRSRGRNKC